MHILDLIMYLATITLLWYGMAFFSGGQLTEEIGGLLGSAICIVYSVAYLIVFCFYPDLDWIDIFSGKYSMPFKITW